MSRDTAGAEDAVFVPLGLQQWRELLTRRQLPGPLVGHGVTPALRAWGEFGPDEDEDAVFAAQSVAGVAALTLEVDRDERRIVIAVAGTDGRPRADSSLGEVEVSSIDLDRVRALFADDPQVDPGPARDAARGRTVAQAWDDPVVAQFSEDHDLGWYGLGEATDW
ncbi:MAG TPA: hypothetical protein IAA98_11410 [Candidatus Avipropionibacterium avicola]|uniref:Uncharacterized protein n=1 Tax=Candidatus Avipropionibacterium avicola TaxID=2840701 RepID=A0A9D1KN00_9ACTN|nr:hypothetical protein [Candidatus Avipropionibacterium avicola]